jgi:hypothetical protein
MLIGTDVDNLNETKNFLIGDIANFILADNYVPYLGATKNVDLGIYTVTGAGYIVNGGAATEFLKADGSLDATVYQPAGNYITQLSGEATASGPGNASVTLSNSAVINKVLTGLTITGDAVVATDSILTAFGKVQNQINTLVGGVQYKGTWNAATNTPTLVSSVGVQGNYYVVSVSGNTNLNGITDWKLGDWAIFNGSAWEKVDNTDAVISVNGQIGEVVLTTTDIAEGTNLYYTDLRARSAISLTTTGNSGASTYSNLTGVLNVPNYTLAGLGGVPLTRQLTINGTTFDLSANRTWDVGTVTSVATSGPLTGGTITGSGTIGITQSGASSDGFLSSTDWNTFNNKQNAITNPVTGTGTANTLPMWGSSSSLTNSPLSYAADAFNFGFNSATGGTVNFTNTGLTPYTYAIQMNNFGSPRSTVHSYTDGIVVNSIGGTQVSRMFANGNFILGAGFVDNGYKLEVTGTLALRASASASAATQVPVFIADPSGTTRELVTRTPAQLLGDAGGVTGTGASGQVAFWNGTSSQTGDKGFTRISFSSYRVGNLSNNGSSENAVFTIQGSTDNVVQPANHARQATLNLISSNQGGGFTNYTSSINNSTLGLLTISNTNNSSSNGLINFSTNISGTQTSVLSIRNNGNVIIQNGGTFTDAGFRLDVNGTARVQGDLTITGTNINMQALTGVVGNSTVAGIRNNGGTLGYVALGFSSNLLSAISISSYQNANTGFLNLISDSHSLTTTYANSAVLEVRSTTRGFLPPRMTTTQRNAIASPATGLIVYDNTLNDPFYFNGTAWTMLQDSITLTTTGTSGAATLISNVLNIPQYTDQFVGTVTSVGLSAPTGFAVSNSPVTSSGTLTLSFASGYSLPTDAVQANWTTAYNDSIISAAVTGTVNKTLTLNQQDGGTITASWTDIAPVTSVFGRLGDIVAQSGDYNTSQVTESGNLYFTNARARTAISLTTTGSSGAATYDSGTGVFNIPNYGSALTGYVPYTGANQTVNLNTQQLQAGHATFTTNGSTDTLTINHTSGSGRGIVVTKSGSGEGLTVVKGSGSGNAASITGGITLLTTLNLTNALADTYIASAANWNTAYNNRITSLTTTGTSGAATLVSHVLNIPQYQAQGSYITSLTGEATASGPGAASVTLTNSAVTGKVLTGLTVAGSSIASTDSILTAFGKLQGQVNDLIGGLQYQGTWNASTNTPNITSGVGTDGHFYIVSVAGNTTIDGVSGWQVGDWIVFHAPAWQKVDNTESVVSVNGFTGAVTLTTTNISEGTNLYFTDGRARTAISLTTSGNSGASTYNNGTGVLNVPQYSLAGLGGVPTTRTLTINGTAFDLSADRTWSVGTVTSVATSGPITGGTITGTGTIGITQASSSSNGFLSSTDWNTFNGKQNTITLTTTGTSGAATLVGATLNIPQYQSVLTNPITGTGTINYLSKFTGTSAIGNSLLFDNGSGLGLGTASINASALFQMDSTTKGFLPPRMTAAQRGAISAPAQGLIIFQTDGVIGLYIYANSTWRTLGMI